MAFQGIGRFFYNYEITENAIEFTALGGLKLKSLPLSAIEDLREVSLKDTLRPDFSTLRLGNRLVGRIIEIRPKNGLFRRILITPDDPDKFLMAWKEKKGK